MIGVDAGELRHRVGLVRITKAQDDWGGPTEAEVVYATTWANVTPVNGNERLANGIVNPIVTHVVDMRKRSDILPDDRIRHNGRTFEIDSIVDVDERRRNIRAMCVELVTSA